MLDAAVFPLPSCGDYLPLLAIQDGRLGELVEHAGDFDDREDALDYCMKSLYPNGSHNG